MKELQQIKLIDKMFQVVIILWAIGYVIVLMASKKFIR